MLKTKLINQRFPRCTYFLGGPCSGSAVALTMNGGKYEDIYILEDKRKITRY